MFNESVAFMLSAWFGTDSKKETLGFIWTGMAGFLAVIGAIVVNRRAREQIKTNRLIEQGHNQDRFKAATEHLGKPETQIAAYYEFCQLAKNHENLRKIIFDILCAHLRKETNTDEYKEKPKEHPTENIQSLLDILFKPESEFKNIFEKFDADLSRTNISYTNLDNACMNNVNFTRANLTEIRFGNANLQNSCFLDADLRDVMFMESNLQDACFHGAYLQNVMFAKSDLQDVDFIAANFQSVKFLLVQNLTSEMIEEATIDETTTLPYGISHPSRE